MVEPFLRMTGIKKHFPGIQALKGVDLEAYPGEVLALMGANGAGKSTLMNVLGGVVEQDDGRIYIGGEPVDIRTPLDAAHHGVAFVHQEMALMPTMTIADNLYLTAYPSRFGVIDYKLTEKRCVEALGRLGYSLSPRTKIRELGAGDRQIVEITRALLSDPDIVIFDEPTSSLTNREKERLFNVIASLKEEGVTIIYITHLMDEVFSVCDRAVVLRNGETAGQGLIRDLSRDDLVEMMIGSREPTQQYSRESTTRGEVALQVRGLNRRGVLQDIDFALHRGEIVGLWGLLGSGRTELVRALVGLDPIDSGTIEVVKHGQLKTVRPHETGDTIGVVTEDRRDDGLALPMPVRANMSAANLPRLLSRVWPLIDGRREMKLCLKYVERLGIKIADLEQPAGTLSGGNQQKVVVARWLQRNPIIYLLDEPTRGLDIGAKSDIHGIAWQLATDGAAILVIMSDIDEIMSICHRYLVMNQGRIVAELPARASKNELMRAAAGGR